jgi:hypothetical protein
MSCVYLPSYFNEKHPHMLGLPRLDQCLLLLLQFVHEHLYTFLTELVVVLVVGFGDGLVALDFLVEGLG